MYNVKLPAVRSRYVESHRRIHWKHIVARVILSTSSQTVSHRIANWLIAHRKVLLVVGILISIAAYFPASELRFDRSIENMFAPSDPILVAYRTSKRIFGGEAIALAAYVDPELLTPEGMQRLTTVTNKLEQVPGVDSVMSLNNNPILGDEIIKTDKPVSSAFLDLMTGFTIGEDRETTAVVCFLVPEATSEVSRDDTVEMLREVIEEYPKGVITGEPAIVVDGFRYLEADSTVLGRASTALLVLTIVLCFRSLRWVVIPLIVVNVTLLITKAILVLGGFRLSMVSSMLWAIVTVIGIGAVVHIIVRFRELRAEGKETQAALSVALSTLLVPIIWTCFTDAAGFGSLLWAKVGPIQDFGVMMTFGAVLALVSMALMLPGLALLGRFDTDPKQAWGEGGLSFGLSQTISSVERFPMLVGGATVLFAGVAIYGIRWLEVETDFTKNFRANSPVVKSYEFVEEDLGGAGVWDVLFPIDGELDHAFLDKVRMLQDRLRTEVVVVDEQGKETPGLTKVMSLVDALEPFGNMTASMPVQELVTLFRGTMPAMINPLLGEDPDTGQQYYRIMLRARERQPSRQKSQIIQDVTRISQEEFPRAQATGFFVLLTQLINSIVRDQWVTFSIAIVAIGIMMLVAFRSIRLALVALVPNALPILVLTGLMGWASLRINMGAAMIAAVSMGLSVDSSIHYLTEFRRVRRQGYTVHNALMHAHQTVGRAMVFSTLAIMIGFSALTLSQFIPLVYFGVLVSLALAGGTAGNLIVLPLLLQTIERD